MLAKRKGNELMKKTNEEIIESIKNHAGNTIFSVKFIKKDGSERKMICRFGVQKDLTSQGLAYNPKEKGYLTVYDMEKKGYRTINTATITDIKIKGKKL